MEINFAGGAYETFSKSLNAQECVNFFVHVDQHGGSSQLSLRGTPGLKKWCDLEELNEIRGVKRLGEYLYAVVGNKIFRVNSQGGKTECTGTLDTYSGSVSMASSSTETMIVDGVHGYITSGTTVTKIEDDAFPDNPMIVTHQDGYFLISIKDSGRIYISDLNDGTSWDGTMFFNAEGYSDDTLSVDSFHRDVILFGEDTFEIWYNSGATVPFDRKPGTTQHVGIGAKNSVVQIANTIFFLSNEFQVVTLAGYQPKPVSTRSIDYQISQYSKKNDAVGMGLNIEGNAFYVLTFPTEDKTWCYNATNGFWHQLKGYPYPYNHRWRGNCSEFFSEKHIVGDYQNGVLYECRFDVYQDNSELIQRTRVSEQIKQQGNNVFHHKLEIFFEPGVGLATGQGNDPYAMLQYSDDGGDTWSSEIWRSIGKIGKHQWRAVWNRLGASRHRNYKITVTDPVEWVITNANLEFSNGTS